MNRSTSDAAPFYVGAVVGSQSGYLFPRLITSTQELGSAFGDFPYRCMYRDLIARGIPVCIMPVVTPGSTYNVPSLRLSSSIAPVSHPRKDRVYSFRSEVKIHAIEFTLTKTENRFEFKHRFNYFPRSYVVIDGKLIKENSESVTIYHRFATKDEVKDNDSCTRLLVEVNTSKIDFEGKKSFQGLLIIEDLPTVQSVQYDEYINSGTNWEPRLPGEYADYYFESVHYAKPPKNDVWCKEVVDPLENVKLTGNKLDLSSNSNKKFFLRCIPKTLLRYMPLLPEYRLDTVAPGFVGVELMKGRYPTLSVTGNQTGNQSLPLLDWYFTELVFGAKNALITDSFSSENTVVRTKLSLEQIEDEIGRLQEGETTFGVMLDFSKVSYDDLFVEDPMSGKLSPRYVLIATPTGNAIICVDRSNVGTSSGSQYGDAVCELKRVNDPISPEEKKREIIKQIREWFNGRYLYSCLNRNDVLTDFVQRELREKDFPIREDNGKYLYLEEWIRDTVHDRAFRNDFWIISPREAVKVLDECIHGLARKGELSKSSLIKGLEGMDLPIEELLFVMSKPIQDLKITNIPGLTSRPMPGCSMDKLCEVSEEGKVVEFYSKIKGEAGAGIEVVIEDVEEFEGVYEITVQNDFRSENYTVRLFDVGDIPIDTIFIDDISKLSNLVEVYLYNYWLKDKDGNRVRLVDSLYLNEYTDEGFDGGNLRDIKELRLPVGSFHLDRFREEKLTEEDYRDSLEVYRGSDWFPDLFLVDRLPDIKGYCKWVLDLVDFKPTAEESIFSQALVKLDYQHLSEEWMPVQDQRETLIGKNNRMLYFLGDLTINGETYPSFYPYVVNFLTGRYLDVVRENILYRYDQFLHPGSIMLLHEEGKPRNSARVMKRVEVESQSKTSVRVIITRSSLLTLEVMGSNGQRETLYGMVSEENEEEMVWQDRVMNRKGVYEIVERKVNGKEATVRVEDPMGFVERHKINTFRYDNLRYYYETVLEPAGQPSVFLLRFISSKFTRELYKIRRGLIGVTMDAVRQRLGELIDRCTSCLPLVSRVDSDFAAVDDKLYVVLVVWVESITNKPFSLEFIINSK